MKSIFTKLVQLGQKRFGLDISYFAKNSFLGIIQQGIGVTCGLSIIYVFGHYASKLLFGQYNYVLSIFGLLNLLAIPGLDNALIRSVAKGHEQAFVDGIITKIRYSLLALPLFLGFIVYYFIKGDSSIALSLALIAVAFPFLTSLPLYTEFLTAKKEFLPLTILQSFSSIITAIFLGLAIYLTQNLLVIILMYILSIIIPSIPGLWFAFRIKKNNSRDKNITRYGRFLSSLNFITWATGYVGQIMIGSFLGLEQLAIYSAAHRFPVSIQKNIFVFYKPITSKLAHQSNKDHQQTIKRHSWKLLAIGLILTALVYTLSPILINFFFTYSYHEAIWYAQLLSLSILPLPLTWVLSDILLYQNREKDQVKLTTYPQVVKFLLYLVLIPIWGIGGLVFVFVLERYLSLFLAWRLVAAK